MLNIINIFDKDHFVPGVMFENLRVNGKLITNAEEGNIKVGEYTKNIVFKNTGQAGLNPGTQLNKQ